MDRNVFVKPNEQNKARFSYVMARKHRTKSNLGTISRWMTNKILPSVEPLELCSLATSGTQEIFDIAKHLDVDARELLVSSK
jgi:hypothetical protein